jgi:hypothetical protein
VEKYCIAGQATDDDMAHAHCMLGNQGYKHTLRICNTYYFFSTAMVARTRHNVMLYIHFLSCYNGDHFYCALGTDSGPCCGSADSSWPLTSEIRFPPRINP